MICSPKKLIPEPKTHPPSPLHPDNPTPHPAKEYVDKHVKKRKPKHTNNPNPPPRHKPSA